MMVMRVQCQLLGSSLCLFGFVTFGILKSDLGVNTALLGINWAFS